jgi:glycosyltransferase involved in cell wall biosynthesis
MTTPSPHSKATWIVTRMTADIRWRVEMPAKHLGAKTILVEEDHLDDYLKPNTDGVFRWSMTMNGAEYPDIEGTVIWTRPDINRAIHGAAMSALGHRVICEVDDNYLSPKEQNIFMRQNNYSADKRNAHMRAFMSMDAVIFATEALRNMYTKAFKKELGHVPETFIARNHVDPDDWKDRTPIYDTTSTRLRVGWAGSLQHVWDLRLAAPALHLAREMGAEIVLIGLDPSIHDKAWTRFLGEYTHIPLMQADKYHTHYLNLDIGLAPLVTNQHTMGKSDVKALEYAMSGAAIVAQNNPVYNTAWKHDETCLLAGSPDEMALAVRSLIRDKRKRIELAQAAKEYVLADRTIQGNIGEWGQAL